MQLRGISRKIAGIVLLGLMFSCKEEKKNVAGRPRRNMPLQAEAYIVRSTTLSENIEVPGTILPFEETQILAEIPGRVVKLNIPEGSFVQQGTLLVKLFDDDLQAQLKKLEVQLQIAEKTFERYKELLKISGISQQEVDLSELQVNNLKADIDLVKVNISKTEIRAPFSGRIGLKNVSLGAYISPAVLITTISQIKIRFSPELTAKGSRNIGFVIDIKHFC